MDCHREPTANNHRDDIIAKDDNDDDDDDDDDAIPQSAKKEDTKPFSSSSTTTTIVPTADGWFAKGRRVPFDPNHKKVTSHPTMNTVQVLEEREPTACAHAEFTRLLKPAIKDIPE